MAAVNLMPYVVNQYFDDNGKPLSGGKLHTYQGGTDTEKVTHQDPYGLVPHTNPITLDAAGRTTVFLAGGAYKFVLKNAAGVTVWTEDNISVSAVVSEVNSVDDIRDLIGGVATFVRTLGYRTPNDGGGWVYYWDSSSTATHDGGMVIQPSSLPATGRWIGVKPSNGMLNVRVYGAVCDGVTDDVSELQACDTYCNTNGYDIFADGALYFATDPDLDSRVKLLPGVILSWGSFQPALKLIIDDATQHFTCAAAYAPALDTQYIVPEWFGETLQTHPITTACAIVSQAAARIVFPGYVYMSDTATGTLIRLRYTSGNLYVEKQTGPTTWTELASFF